MTASQPPVPPSNPYAPPAANLEAPAPAPAGAASLASRGARFGASFIDGLLYAIGLVPAIVVAVSSGALTAATEGGGQPGPFWWAGTSPVQIASALVWVALLGFQSYLIATTGQSIGKKVVKIRIVRTDGSRAGFVRAVLLRSWLFGVFSVIPIVGRVSALVDVVFIFRNDRRCLHDMVADTRVVDASVIVPG
jgi:uncharacterized RDD family membrane protein YckC